MELTRGETTQTQATYGYDSLSRIVTLGNGSDALNYSYRPGMDQLQTAQWRNAQDVALNGRSYEYDTRHRLTEIKLDGVREVAYTLNDKDQRTAAEYANSGAWNFTYDDKSQVIGAVGNNTNFAYNYDEIGNRTAASEGSNSWTYASNLLDQYTAINAMQPTYDADGNILTWNGWAYTWNGENRLVAAENGDIRVEMSYDHMGRRFEKKVYTKGLFTFYNWTLQKHEKYVYNGYKQIASYDAQNSDALLATYTWQPVDLDVPVSMTRNGETFYYVTDGNKNITALLDATGTRVTEYTYGPFGQALEADGALAEDNPFRFSSEFHDDELNLVYYNYRHYNPTLGRWIKRDPIEEGGGVNLYGFVKNDTSNKWDEFGFAWKGKREPDWEWAKVYKERSTDSLSGLANSIGLGVSEAFGDNGWLRRNNGGAWEIVKDQSDFNNSKTRCSGVSNVIAIIIGAGADLSELEKGLKQVLKAKKFYISSTVTGANTYGVIYAGHFQVTSGIFMQDGSNANETSENLHSKVGHKINFFAGIGCLSNQASWGAIASKTWLTDYKLKVTDANDSALLIYSEYIESTGSEYGNHMEGKKKGNSGTLLRTWILGLR